MEEFWSMICGDSSCSKTAGKPFCYDFKPLKDPSSCINHLLIICFDVLVLIMLSFMMTLKSSSIPFWSPVRYSNLQLVSAIINSSLGLLHLCLGIWVLEEKLRKTHNAFPLHWWLLELFQGCTWLLVSLTICLRIKQLRITWLWLCSFLIFLVSGILCALSMCYAIDSRVLSLKTVLDVLSFPGATLLLLCTYQACKCEEQVDGEIGESLYAPLNRQFNEECDPVGNVTTFAKAGLFSKISFWWLNPLMRKGQEKTLQDEDIPKLRESDQAKSCYFSFVEQLNRQRQKEPSSRPSVLWTIILCNRREIFVTGFCALLKVLTLSCGPLLLNAFILVAEGNQSFKYEGYVLAISLFFIKIIESLSQRQWYFRCRLVGMKVRSLLTAAIYKKSLRLSNSARLIHSGGEIMNYMTVDAYRIGEFPFWFHKTWTTILQLCIALVILFRAIGLATIASLVVIVITVLCNTPLVFLFWTSPMLVSAASFLACYFLNIPLHASNVFTFVATLRLVQDPITGIPDVIGVIIQAKVAFARIVKFLEAPELQSEKLRNRCFNDDLKSSILIKSADFSWEDNVSKPTLRNINLEVRHGQKLAICGEVGSGKSTLLATILGEVPNTKGAIDVYGKFAYVSQTAWIQSGTIRENILFGSELDDQRYQETLQRSALVKDLELLPYGDHTEIGERGVNLSGGQKQRIQLARALYQNADLYLLDDPFSAVDAHKYLNQMKGYIFFFVASLSHLLFVVCQILQNSWMAANVDNPHVRTLQLILVYFLIGASSTFFLLSRSLLVVALGLQSSKVLFSQMMNSLFRAPMSFYDSTPLGRILSRVSSDLSILDLDIPFILTFAVGGTINFYSSLTVLSVITWHVLIVAIPMVYVAIRLQRYYFASAKEVMRMNGTTKSFVANHLAETVAGAVTIRAFEEEDSFFEKNLDLIDTNASAFFP